MDEPPGPDREDQERATWVDHALYALLGCLLVALLISRSGFSPTARLQALLDAFQPAGGSAQARLPGPLSRTGGDHPALWDAYATAYSRAHQLAQERKFSEALPLADQACAMDTRALPADARAAGHLLRGTILSELKNFEEAVAAINQARSLTPGALIYEALAAIYFKRKDYRQAVAFGRDFLDSGGKVTPEIYSLLATSHDRLGDVEQASQWIGRGRAEFPDDATLARLGTRYDREAHSERGMATHQDARFILKFVEVREQAHVRDQCLRALERAYTSTCAAYVYQPREALPVILYPSPGAYYNASGAPQWSAAQYDGKIRVPLPPGDRSSRELEAVMAHEMTHYVIHQVAGDKVPAWLDEGLAQLAEQRDDAWAHAELARGQRFALADLEKPFVRLGSTDQARLAYAQALVTTRRLVDQVGMPRMRGILDQLAAGRKLDELVDIR